VQVELLPTLMTRICGTCPHAHHLVAAKTVDQIFSASPPPAAILQRRLLNFGSFVHSHAIHFFLLSGPDFLQPSGSKRNALRLLETVPEIAKAALRLRSLGQLVAQFVGGRGTHPVTAVAGGMAAPLRIEQRDSLQRLTEEMLTLAKTCTDFGLEALSKRPDLLSLDETRSTDLATVDSDGLLELYDGKLRWNDESGARIGDFGPEDYTKWMTEDAQKHSYAKQVFGKTPGGSRAQWRVGPLARLNVATGIGTPLAQIALERLRSQFGSPCHLPMVGHLARLVELLHCAEASDEIARNDGLFDANVLTPAKTTSIPRGIAHVEAPRGVLLYDIETDQTAHVKSANLLVATQHNLAAIDASLAKAAARSVGQGDGPMLEALEFTLRAYDPCLSCATHQIGQMPMQVTIRQRGQTQSTIRRDPCSM
jgi:F420-non-reducing hydrogenase large subunit